MGLLCISLSIIFILDTKMADNLILFLLGLILVMAATLAMTSGLFGFSRLPVWICWPAIFVGAFLATRAYAKLLRHRKHPGKKQDKDTPSRRPPL